MRLKPEGPKFATPVGGQTPDAATWIRDASGLPGSRHAGER